MYDKILPFYRKAPAISTFKQVVPVNRILACPMVRNEEFESLMADDAWRSSFVSMDDDSFEAPMLDFPMLRIMPLDVYIPATMSDRAEAFASVLIANEEEIPQFRALVRTVDYSDVYFRLEMLDERDGEADVVYPTFYGYDLEEDAMTGLLQAVPGGSVPEEILFSFRTTFTGTSFETQEQLESFRRYGDRHAVLTEGLLDKFSSTVPDRVIGGPSTADDIELSIEQYLSHSEQFGTAHLLKGLTGVAKSAVIKSVCKRLGFRMIDFRAAFIDKLDLMGPIKIEREGENTFYSGAPMKKIVECTDEFMDYAQKMVDYLTGLQEQNPDKDFSKVIDYYRERTKVPVLFFDEITRASKAIRNALFDIVDRKFLNYNMTRCRVIAATNEDIETAVAFGVNADGTPRKQEFAFSTSDGSDGAFRARFNTIEVRSGQVANRWLSWAEAGGVPEVLYSFLIEQYEAFQNSAEVRANPMRGIANAGPLYDYSNVKTDDEEVASITPYPNYRTWDILGQYLKAKQKEAAQADDSEGPVIDTQIVQKLIGNHAQSWTNGMKLHQALLAHLESQGFVIVDSEDPEFLDPISFRLRESMLAGIPMMMLGPTSLGKTGRANAVATELFGEKPFKITLSQKDRTDILGFPVSGSVSEFAIRMLKESGLDDVVDRAEIDKLGIGLPQSMSDYAPEVDLARKLKECAAQGRPVVLFFEEYTRADKVVQSAVFEAISDRRFMGVEFPPGLHVSVIAAGNYGSNYRDTNQMDSAMAARFCMDVQDGYSMRDAAAMLNHFKGVRYTSVRGRQVKFDNERLAMHPSVVAYLTHLFERDGGIAFAQMLGSIELEEGQVEGGVTSPRAWENVSKLLTIASGSTSQGLGFPLLSLIMERAGDYPQVEVLSTLPQDVAFESDPEKVLGWILNMAAVLKAVMSRPEWILKNSPALLPVEKKAALSDLLDFLMAEIPNYDVTVEGMSDLKDTYGKLYSTIKDLTILEEQGMSALFYQVVRFIGNYKPKDDPLSYSEDFWKNFYNNPSLEPYLSAWLAVYQELYALIKFMPPDLTAAQKAAMLGMTEEAFAVAETEAALAAFSKIDVLVKKVVMLYNKKNALDPNMLSDLIQGIVLQDLHQDPQNRAYPLVEFINKLADELPGVSIGALVQSEICSNEFMYRQVTMCSDKDALIKFYTVMTGGFPNNEVRDQIAKHVLLKKVLANQLPAGFALESLLV